ncbi:IclR family transcriptional regulator [Pseudomonas alliivorans]|uniref:IclR family transcriptional regulator n=1 Tax=Pseudomonas alliivorans TaxID=2810613 RepID=UPI001AE2D271|nr:IclR family transcriptional regulator [Pseudomonas alliivorans]MBP0942521.1 IclR family transcriptional regulator [Pseudomonas alliivorans]MCO5366143.1 IclR family transcriptional regulator [Pseudomonas alliivorans]MEE4309577.1 IclR family transcriptional regulator [Pseudomonas alliivorans]MEE4344583.1 IclR family transcriptional regulator [Pseudomonas alliivorans]MEE4370926.1 IclR family transcriptional regulator [Pseudomonas alliivorans]
MTDATEKDTDYIVPALARGLSVLGMFSAQTRSLGMHEIAGRLGVSTSAVYRILFTLTDMGYLNKNGTQYELGARVISDGFSYLASRDIVDVAMPHLNRLRDQSSLSCHLSIREQTDSLYLYRAFAAQRLSVNVPVGTRIACHCTAMGRMLLTALDDAELSRLYQHIRLDDYPAPAPRTLPELQAMTRQDRERGWVLHRSDYATAIATSIKDHAGKVTAAINLSGPDAIMDPDGARERFQDLLLACSAHISSELGYRP